MHTRRLRDIVYIKHTISTWYAGGAFLARARTLWTLIRTKRKRRAAVHVNVQQKL